MLWPSICKPMIRFVFLQAFAIFCGLGIHNAQMYEQACKLLAKQTVAMDVRIYFNKLAWHDLPGCGIVQPEFRAS